MFSGIALGETAMRRKLNSFGSLKIGFVSLILIVTTLILYNYLSILGLDPNRSIDMALKWCSVPENVHMDTTPLYCCTRYSGVILGIALGNYKATWQKKLKLKLKIKANHAKFFIAMIGLAFAYSLSFDLSKSYYIYPLSYLSHGFMIFAMVRVAPEIVVRLASINKVIGEQKLN